MKKILSFLLAFAATCASAATLNPVQSLNPSGSTSGQAILSTGPSTAPGWASTVNSIIAGAGITLSGTSAVTVSLTTPVTVALGGTGWTTLATHYVLLGEGTAQLGGAGPGAAGQMLLSTGASSDPAFGNNATITGGTITNSPISGSTGSFTTLSASSNSASFTLNDAGGTGFPAFLINNAGTNVWAFTNNSSTGTLTLNRYVSGTLTDSPISIANGTGIVTMVDGINGTPISGSTGSFTTLGASGLITPTYPAGIKGNVSGSAVSAGSIAETISSSIASGSAVSLTTGTPANVTSISLTAGDWDVFGAIDFNLGTGVTVQIFGGSANTTSAVLNPANFVIYPGAAATVTTVLGTAIPGIPVRVSATTTVFLVAQGNFSGGTLSAYGSIYARRR